MFAGQQTSSLNSSDNIETEFFLYFSSFQKWFLLCCCLCGLLLSRCLGQGRWGVVWGLSKYPQDDKVISEKNFSFDWLLCFQSVTVPYFHIGGQIIWAKQYSAVWKQLAFMGTILFFTYPFF